MVCDFSDWEEKQYLVHYRMSKGAFWFICERYDVLPVITTKNAEEHLQHFWW